MSDTAVSRLAIYSMGVCCASVCADSELTAEEVEADVNLLAPTGIASRWVISEDPSFDSGHPNPCPCNSDPTRQHWLLNC